MPDILHRVGIAAKPNVVFAALASIDGLRQWWISDATGSARVGGVIDFGFCRMKVLRSQPGRVVEWSCIRGPAEWIGTQVRFTLTWKMRQTFVLFTHAGWREPVEFMHHCSTKWATFLLSLKNAIERSEGRPAPYDVKLHVGD
jgi:uncharacterized protein YndB with AHSA1/START domain